MKKLFLLFFISSCSYKNPFFFTSNYRKFPIAVDCDHAEDVHLTFQKEGMPTILVDGKSVEYKIIKNDKGEERPICIFENLNLIEFCNYKGADEVAPYWVPTYQRINAVKCREVLR